MSSGPGPRWTTGPLQAAANGPPGDGQSDGWFRGAARRTFQRGTLIYGYGDTASRLFVVESGLVKLYRLTPQGRETGLVTVEPGATFGEEAVIGVPTRAHYAEALTLTRVSVLSAADVAALTADQPEALLAICRTLWRRLADLEHQVENLTYRKVSHRLADALAQIARRFGEPTERGIRLPDALTHESMAEYIGSRRETVTVAMGELVDAGLITHDRNRARVIVVPDLDRLEQFANSVR